MNPLASLIATLGLSEEEARVYLALLELGSQPASVAARKAGFKRGHTYNILHSLAGKGIVQEFIKGKTRSFTACSPASLISILENRRLDLENQKRTLTEALPDLERLRNPAAVQPKVRFFQGVEGIKEIYEETLRGTEKEIYAIGDFEHFFPKENNPELHEWVWNYCKRRAEKGIWYLGILNKSPTSDIAFKKRKAEKRKLKMLQGVDLEVEINIYGNTVAVMSSSKDMVGLIVEDKPTADTLRNFHKAIWQMLPDYAL